MPATEGVRRLSMVLGVLGAAPGLLIAVIYLVDEGLSRPSHILFGICSALAGFLIGWGGVRVVSWIVQGFRQDRNE